MNSKTQTTLTFSLLVILVAMAVFLFFKMQQLEQQLLEAQNRGPSPYAQAQGEFFDHILAIDSLLVQGAYRKAGEALEQIPGELLAYEEFAAEVQMRRQNLDRLLHLQGQVSLFEGKDPYQVLSAQLVQKRQQLDSLSDQLSSVQQRHRAQYDSLNFALEKASMRTEILKSQLASTAELAYLTFENEQEEDLYYVGEVKREAANGWGVALSSAGHRYEGEWKNNQYHGEGVLHWPDGEYYKGSFQNGERHGHGNYYWPDGEMFSGEWAGDQRNGKGVFYGKDGKVIAQGTWQDNELVKVKK